MGPLSLRGRDDIGIFNLEKNSGQSESSALLSTTPDKSPLVYEFINSTDGVSLATAVLKIKNKAVRRQILELARSLSESQDD